MKREVWGVHCATYRASKIYANASLRSHEGPQGKVTARKIFFSVCKTRNCDLPRNSRVQNRFLN